MQLSYINGIYEPTAQMIARALNPLLEPLETIRDATRVVMQFGPPLKSNKGDEILGIRIPPMFVLFFSLKDAKGAWCDIPSVHSQTLSGAFYKYDDGRCCLSIDRIACCVAQNAAGTKAMFQEYAEEVLRILMDDTTPTLQ